MQSIRPGAAASMELKCSWLPRCAGEYLLQCLSMATQLAIGNAAESGILQLCMIFTLCCLLLPTQLFPIPSDPRLLPCLQVSQLPTPFIFWCLSFLRSRSCSRLTASLRLFFSGVSVALLFLSRSRLCCSLEPIQGGDRPHRLTVDN